MHLRGVLLVLLTACGVDPTRADPDADASTGAADSSSTGTPVTPTTGTPDPAATSGGELTGAISDPWMDGTTTIATTSSAHRRLQDRPEALCSPMRLVAIYTLVPSLRVGSGGAPVIRVEILPTSGRRARSHPRISRSHRGSRCHKMLAQGRESMSFDRVTRNHSAGGHGGGAGMGQMTPGKRTPRVIAFPHEPPISARVGRIPGTAVLDPYGCEARGAPAFTDGLTSHFSSETPSLHVASHEATHQLQHAGLTNDAELGAERHAHEVANAVVAGTPAEALLGGHGAAVPSATRDYTELTVAEQRARRQWEVGADARIGDAGRTVTTTNRRDCWAERELITSANEILKAKKSGIELKEGSAGLIGPAPDGSGWKSLVEVIPNVDQYWADCGRASREVQGPTGTDTEARGVFKDSSGTKQETSVASDDPEALRNEIYVKGGLGPDSATAHAAYLALSPADKDAFDQRHGINRYAAPEVGESYVARRDDTQSSEGFNWHWGAVVMVAEPDRITFENFAKPGTTYNTKDDLWYFESHGPPTKPGQTFHEHNLSSVGAPDKNTTTMTTRTSSDPRDMSALGTAELVSRYNAATNDGERSVVETELKTRTITVNVKVKKAQEGTDQIYVYIAGSNGSHESGYRELADGGETTFYVPVSELLPIDGALSVRVYEYDAIFDDMISNIAWASPYAPQVDNRPWDDAEYHTTVKFNL